MSNDSEQSKLALAFTVGTLISSSIGGGLVAGYYLDRWLKTDPWLLITGVVLGTVGAFTSLYRVLTRLN